MNPSSSAEQQHIRSSPEPPKEQKLPNEAKERRQDLATKASLLKSFSLAFQGLVHAVRFQRNMRIHLGIAVLVLVASLVFDLSRFELMMVFLSITFVLVAELVNSAIETVVDMITEETHPKAKTAKDVAAGAVLVAAVNALFVAYLVFSDRLQRPAFVVLRAIRQSPAHLTFVAFALVMAITIAFKAWRAKKGVKLAGGFRSMHAALAFAGWTAVTFLVGATRQGLLASLVCFIMALLVAESRIEAGIHSVLEVLAGAILGILVVVGVFQLWQ